MWWLLILVAILGYAIYKIVIKPIGYWRKRKIVATSPWTFIKNLIDLILQKKSIMEMQIELYNLFPDKRYHGVYSLSDPILLIRDPDLIKQVTIKDFDHFLNRVKRNENEIDPLLSKHLFALRGKQWRDMRTTLSPSFTSSKMKLMFTLLSDCAEQFLEYFEKQDSKIIKVEMKDISSRFTIDGIATTAFGINVNSLKEKENEFLLMGKEITVVRIFRALGFSIFPTLMKLLRIPMLPFKISNFFRRIIKETIQMREKNGVVRPDMIHLLLETRKGKLTNTDDNSKDSSTSFAVLGGSSAVLSKTKAKLTDDDITAQAMLFFTAGFDTSSTLMSFMSHELAVHPEIQEKLQDEIDETFEKCGGKITYEALHGMKYMDMVIAESLRKWPPAIMLFRFCEKDYVNAPKSPEERSFTIENGSTLIIPVIGIHYNSKYFPNPERFDPERFSEENKSNIVPGSYIPFGIGPRSCIASRFALMETKILFFKLLSKFDIVPTEKTVIPLVLTKKKFVLEPDEGFLLGLQKRKAK